MQVGFLIAGNDAHHVAHMLPVAEALARTQPQWAVHILTTGKAAADQVDRCSQGKGAHPTHLRLIANRRGRASAVDPRAVLLETDVLPWLDGLVVSRPEAASSRTGPSARKTIYLCPGANDRAQMKADCAAFDHMLVAGEKSRFRLASEGRIDSDRISVVGCPLFDTPGLPEGSAPAADGRKIVLYSPHHSPDMSSWHRWGRNILDWFVEHDDHRLIFAPHPRLFEHRLVRAKDRLLPIHVRGLEQRYLQAPNIHVDLDGSASKARAYGDMADLYLGDFGGLLYEFIVRPRPCAFLNAHRIGTDMIDPRFSDWKAGHVIDDPGLFRSQLHIAEEWHADVYRSVQQEMFAHGISTTDIPAALRAASAIATVISG